MNKVLQGCGLGKDSTERLPTHVRHIHNAPRHLRACQGMGADHFGDHRFAKVHVFNLARRAVIDRGEDKKEGQERQAVLNDGPTFR